MILTRILTANLESFIPNKAVDAKLGSHVELHEVAFAFSVDEGESVDTKPLHHTVRARNA